MAIVKFRLDPSAPPQLDPETRARLDAMTEEEIQAAAEADPENPPLTEAELRRGSFARDVRRAREALGMSPEGFAAALGLPAPTLREWERGRIDPDPAARSLIRLVADDPGRAVRLLAG
ncbi:helix-turn-helix domain-containing protein [Methylobacterium oryzisoli]|uniref:helix-turn-helix domain-containing protein n=1 Tax=Methylobacterium oryzisoli TaxID=3385502 RepID=UPI003891EF18